ncbi:sigma-70 family RNA polymerase sigma factor [Thalassoroseus pseudoceratinae]|uniref:sigma-70 family RNA polymerase sigma factor n=1 Tax=Thalassoroseus pseudoceratinae TaxID=2713176 RepID=UPI00142150EA|nr:sigma-70 family RNA polymerase sigma factor [Thalassoroseus pseudoceratinae]
MTTSEPSSTDGPSEPPVPEEFVQLFTRNQRRLYLFILAQCPNPVEAEEILQETNVVIWRKFRQFEMGSSFLAWAGRIAHYEVLKFRERRHRDRHRFSDEFVKHVAEEALEESDQLEARRMALLNCLQKLRASDRELIRHRYATGHSGQDVADQLDRPVNSIYQSLSRIRRTLMECINRQLSTERPS